MPKNLIFVIFILSAIFLVYILKNIKAKKITMKYSLIWILCDLLIVVFALSFNQLLKIAQYIGIKTVSNMLFFAGLVFLAYMILQLTKTISKQNHEIVRLTQKVAIMSEKINEK